MAANAVKKSQPRYTGVFIVAAMVALMLAGVLAIHICEQAEGTAGFAKRQSIYGVVGLACFMLFAAIPYPRFGKVVYLLFAFSLALLILVFFLPPVNNSHRWIDLAIFKIQPSELAKLTLILLLAWYLRLGDHYRRLRGLIPPFVLTLVPMVLVLLEPDLGTSLLFLPTLYIMLFMAGAKLRHLVGIVLVGTVLLFLPLPRKVDVNSTPREVQDRLEMAYHWNDTPWTFHYNGNRYIVSAAPLSLMKHRQLSRISGWVQQGKDDPGVVHGKGYQLRQSKIILGSGKITGHGDWEEGGFYFRTLPEDHTDFIFSIIAGQWGFVGCVILFLLYGVIIVFGVEIVATTHDPFGRLLGVGVLGLLVSQIFINVGMTMGLMPITGMTLPLVSYGGSSLVVNCAAMGLLVNVGQRRPMLLSRRPFEHKEDTSHVPYHPLERPEA